MGIGEDYWQFPPKYYFKTLKQRSPTFPALRTGGVRRGDGSTIGTNGSLCMHTLLMQVGLCPHVSAAFAAQFQTGHGPVLGQGPWG